MNFVDKDLLSIQEARILSEHAAEAKKALALFTQEKLDQILERMCQAIVPHLQELALMLVEETAYGCSQDEFVLLKSLCEVLPARLKGMQCVGILSRDQEEKITEVGVPLGVIAVICPSTSSVAAVISTAFNCVKSGNAVVFAPHVRAQKTIKKTIQILAEEATSSGLPEGALTCFETVSRQGTEELLRNPVVSLVINNGVAELNSAVAKGNKPIIYGGTGSSPVFIERTANIRQAVGDIIESRSFNGGILPGAEQYLVADSLVASEVKMEMIRQGAHFMNAEEEQRLLSFICPENGENDPEYMGKTSAWLAKRAGFFVAEGTKVLVSEQKYISDQNPFAKEIRCPVLAYYIEPDWMYACEKCMELLVNNSKGHTLVIHSKDEDVIEQFARKKPVGRILVNTPAVFGAMGISTNLFPAVTLGAITAGMGITADNVSPMNLIYKRRVGYGIRNGLGIENQSQYREDKPCETKEKELEPAELLLEMLKKLSME